MAEEITQESKPKISMDVKIIIIGLVMFFLAVGTSYFLLKSLMAPLMPQANMETESINGDLLSVGEFTTNIGNISGNRYVKVEIYVEIADKKQMASMEKLMPVIKDSILYILSSKTVADLDVANRENLKTEMKNEINTRLKAELISNIFFTNFIMQ